jgi:hypothetical protein
MIHGAGLDRGFWFYACAHKIKLENMTTSKSNGLGVSPKEAAFGPTTQKEMTLEEASLRWFGQRVAVKRKSHVQKGDVPGRIGYWVGFQGENRSHRLYFPAEKGKRAGYVESTHVRFPPGRMFENVLSGKVGLEAGATENGTGEWDPEAPCVEFEVNSDREIVKVATLHTPSPGNPEKEIAKMPESLQALLLEHTCGVGSRPGRPACGARAPEEHRAKTQGPTGGTQDNRSGMNKRGNSESREPDPRRNDSSY